MCNKINNIYGQDEITKILNKNIIGMNELKQYFIDIHKIQNYGGTINQSILISGPAGVGKSHFLNVIEKSLNKKILFVPFFQLIENNMGMFKNLKEQDLNLNKDSIIVLDEIDKIDFNQHKEAEYFIENLIEKKEDILRTYLGLDINFNNTLVIATARNLNSIPKNLSFKFHLFNLNCLSTNEKICIARENLIPKIMSKYSIKAESCISDDVVRTIISHYTSEAGVHNLERYIDRIVQRLSIENMENKEGVINIEKEQLYKYIGTPNYVKNFRDNLELPGRVIGLAWTNYGGKILAIDVKMIPGNGRIQVTSNIGKVMQESIQIVTQFLRLSIAKWGQSPEIFYKHDFFINIPEGSIQKDGPSAALPIAIAIFSTILDINVDINIAMTGELTLNGDLIRVGGLQEKFNVALNNGIKKIVLPRRSYFEYQKISNDLKESIEAIFVDSFEEAVKVIFDNSIKPNNLL